MNVNNEFLIVFTPKKPHQYNSNRFLISFNRLPDYINVKNANICYNRIKKSKLDKTTFKFRKYGKIEFYSK